MSKVIAVIDGDEVAFTIAAACEKRSVLVTNKSNGESSNFKHRTELKKFLEGLEVPEDYFEIADVQEPDKIENALHSVKVVINNIKENCKADEVEVYLSGSNNFRNFIPLPTQYKSGRTDLIKPLLLPDIRQYLAKQYKAQTVDFQECDDKICARMFDGFKLKQKIIGVTRDKDAMQSSGWLFNPDKMEEPEFIDGLGKLWLDDKNKVRGVGRKWLYTQWIIGDSTDGYKPTDLCKAKYGEKSAYKLLSELQTDKECVQAVYDLYKTWYPDVVKYKSFDGQDIETDAIGIMQMYLDCARMRRWDNDTVSVTDLLDKLNINYEEETINE